MKNQERTGIIEMIIASALAGFMAILVKMGAAFGSQNLAFFRIFLSAIFIYVIFILLMKQKLNPLRAERKKMIFFGVIHAVTILGYFTSILFLSVSIATLLLSSLSIWTVVFSALILKEKIKAKTVFSLFIAFVGLIILISPQNLAVQTNLIGVSLGLIAGIFGGLAYVLSKTFKTYDKVSLAFWQNAFAAPLLLPLLFIVSPVFTLTTTAVILLLGITGALTFVFMYRGLGKITGQIGGVLSLLKNPFAIIFAILIFGEMLTTGEIIGGSMIIAGSFLVSM